MGVITTTAFIATIDDPAQLKYSSTV